MVKGWCGTVKSAREQRPASNIPNILRYHSYISNIPVEVESGYLVMSEGCARTQNTPAFLKYSKCHKI